MRSRELALPVDPDADLPLYRQLAAALTAQVQDGRLVAGDALPSTRDLAAQCGVTRNTVLAAFRELHADGWVESRPGSGTFVAPPSTREPLKGKTGAGVEPAFDLPSLGESISHGDPATLDLREDWPDARLLPADLLGRTYRMAMDFRSAEVLGPGGSGAADSFCRVLAQWLGERWGVWREPSSLLATLGEAGALEIALRGLLKPGARVLALAEPPPALQQRVTALGLELESLAWSLDGPDLAGLENASASLLLVPGDLATGRPGWNEANRNACLDLARRRRMPVLELEGARELFDARRPALPLAAQDPHGVCLLAGGFERTLAPGLRLGYLLGPAAPMRALGRLGRKLGLVGDPLLATVLTRIMEEGELARFFRKVRPLYARRRAGARRTLATALGPGFRIDAPEAGLGLWLQPPAGLEAAAWIRAAAGRGLRLPTPAGEGFWLGFGALTPEAFGAAATIMAETLPGGR